jgi:poly(A) polymerase
LSFAYDDLEERIVQLSAAEELASIRPDLDGEAIMRILKIGPGPAVGRAYRYLLEARLDDGPLGDERATAMLLEWWQSQPDFVPHDSTL